MNSEYRKKLASRIKNVVLPIIILGSLLGILSIYTSYKGYNTLCPIKLVSGFPCPGCGMTRAHLALLDFNLSQAFYYHPLFVLPSLLVVIFLFQDIKWIYRLHHSKWFYPLLIVIILGVYIYRMTIRFPLIEPLDYLEDNFLHGIWDYSPK